MTMRFPTIKISIDRSVLGQLMLGAALLALPIAGHAKRIAMVVGNDNYQHVRRSQITQVAAQPRSSA